MLQGSGFFVATFGIDGELVGTGFWKYSDLSQNWLAMCASYLDEHGAVFDAPWNGRLSHVHTKLTSASGAALATFVIRGHVVSSILLLSGQSPSVDCDVAGMYAKSLRKSAPVMAATRNVDAFGAVLRSGDRPLMAIVAWPESHVTEADHELVRELGVHLAGAFFLKAYPNNP